MNYDARRRIRAVYHGFRLIGAGVSGNKDKIAEYLPSRDIIKTISISHCGANCYGKILYIIREWGGGNGFCAEMRQLLGHLYFADRYGFIPCVCYGPDYLYFDPQIGGNAYEYYFDPIGDDIIPALASNLIESDSTYAYNIEYDACGQFQPYSIDSPVIDRMSDMMRKYVSIKPELLSTFHCNYEEMCHLASTKVLGVHYRGTDFRMNYKDHPAHVTLEQLTREISDCLKNENYQKVFLATDDASAYEYLKKQYGSIIVSFEDTLRSNGSKSVAFSESSRSNHRYLLGLEVLRDMYMLSRCDAMICGLSQVAIMARIYKRANDCDYSYLKVIDNGINQTGKSFAKSLKGKKT